jgi:hypothetical protein
MSVEPTSPAAVVFTDTVLRRFLFGVVLVMTAVVLGVAAAAFYTSFEAIRAFAERSGGSALSMRGSRRCWLTRSSSWPPRLTCGAQPLVPSVRPRAGGSGRCSGCPKPCSGWRPVGRSR